MDTLCDQMMLKGFLMKIPDWITKYTNTLNELHQTGITDKISNSLNIIEEKMEKNNSGASSLFHYNDFVKRFGWGIPNATGWKIISKTISGCKVVELVAGSGFLASCIMANPNKPINYLATDAMKGDDTFTKTYFKVQKLNHLETLTKNPDADVLIINWPTYKDKWASEALRKFKGDIVIYIGEGMGGCNADDGFFEELSENWEEKECEPCIQWQGLRDSLFLYKRKMSE